MTERLSTGRLAQVACMLEATAAKPGNVHRRRDFDDSHYLDYALSALAIGPPLERARGEGLGVAVLDAVRATRALVSTNTNLGMILLLAPAAAVPEELSIEAGLETVLNATTVDDARLVYEAVRLARPGGLASVPEQDIRHEPTVTLREAMALAADRDVVARQYVLGYPDVLGITLPALTNSLSGGRPLETAIISAHLATLARVPDTLVGRKLGLDAASEVSRRASEVLEAGWPDSSEGRRRCELFDRWLREDGHRRNPGATADLVAAALFVGLRDGTIPFPMGPSGWAARPPD